MSDSPIQDKRSQHTDDPPREYTFKELEPVSGDDGSNRQPYIRFIVLLSKKKDVTDEYFHQHWKTFHADLTMSARDFGVQVSRYVQFHTDNDLRSIFTGSGLNFAPYDGFAEFLSPYPEALKGLLSGAFADPAVLEDMAQFADPSSLKIMIGHDNLIYGSSIKTSDGSDGMLPSDPRLVRGPTD